MEQLTLSQVLDYLRDNKYLLVLKGKYSLSEKFQQDAKNVRNSQAGTVSLPSHTNPSSVPVVQVNWVEKFTQFIVEAKVPKFLENSHLEKYAANKYSEAAMKVFRKAIEVEGINYDILVKSVILYYAGAARYKKSIGNYFTEGHWRTGYNELAEAAKGQQTLKEHINQELDNGGNGIYRIG